MLVGQDVILLYGYNSKRVLIGCFLFCFFLAWCPRHIQSVFNLIVGILMDIHVKVN